MRLFSFALMAAILLFASYASNSQTKVAVINSEAFLDEKEGITRYVGIYKALEAEFKLTQDDLVATNAKIEALAREIQALQQQFNSNNPALDKNAIQASLTAKSEEGQRLQIDLKRKQEDAKSRYEKREKQVTAPIIKEMSDALEAFRKKNNIDLILDYSKMPGMVLGVSETIDITSAFIKDFNAKPAPPK